MEFSSCWWKKNNPPPGSPNHDPFAKVCPLLEMCQMNFCLCYTPSEYISLDKSTMSFKGCIKFFPFNPLKPNKFHIKLFMVSEHLSGYISGFSVYTGKKKLTNLLQRKQLWIIIALLWWKLLWAFFKKPSYLIITVRFSLTTSSTSVNHWKKCCTGTHMVQPS